VRPLLSRYLPGLVHTAALIGTGSDVLGLDSSTRASRLLV
jgi:hypothetical protein